MPAARPSLIALVVVAGLSAATAARAVAPTVLSSSGTILHTSNLGTTPPVRSTAPYSPCRVEYNGDGVLNPDDLGDYITDYFTEAPLAGPGGYATPCPMAAVPYTTGWRCNYTSDGSPQCSPPFSDNLGDYITDYFAGCAPVPTISPLENITNIMLTPALNPMLMPSVLSVGAGLANTTAKAGMGTLSTDTSVGIIFSTGTALTQAKNTNPDGATASTLRMTFAASWRLNSVLGPTALAGAGFTMCGSLPPNPIPMTGCPAGPRFAQMDLQAEFFYTLPNGTSGFIRPSINATPFGSRVTGCGPFSVVASNFLNASPTSFPVNTVITVTGTIEFTIHNDIDQASIDNITGFFSMCDGLCPAALALCPADFDRNGSVDGSDAAQFSNALLSAAPGPGGFAVPCPSAMPPFDQGYQADFNHDCAITPDDLALFNTAFNTVCPPPCDADFNTDGAINADDLSDFIQAFNNLTPGPGGFSARCLTQPGLQADINGDCFVDFLDWDEFMAHFAQGC